MAGDYCTLCAYTKEVYRSADTGIYSLCFALDQICNEWEDGRLLVEFCPSTRNFTTNKCGTQPPTLVNSGAPTSNGFFTSVATQGAAEK